MQTQNGREMDAPYTHIFSDVSKIAYRIRICACVIHNHNFAFAVIVCGDKRINCVTTDNTVGRLDYYQFRSANAADENIHRALFRGTQRGYSSKPLNHSIVKHILVFKRKI